MDVYIKLKVITPLQKGADGKLSVVDGGGSTCSYDAPPRCQRCTKGPQLEVPFAVALVHLDRLIASELLCSTHLDQVHEEAVSLLARELAQGIRGCGFPTDLIMQKLNEELRNK